jgi:hypothetical protein
MFRAVLEQEGWSSRALVNWGCALTQRAELAQQADAVEKLYTGGGRPWRYTCTWAWAILLV